MTIRISRKEFEQLSDFIEQSCGITLGSEKAYLIENRLSTLVLEQGCKTFGELYDKLKNVSRLSPLFASMLDAITTNETLWFRDHHPFSILTEYILPLFIKELNTGVRSDIRIWSAACSTGQEPYSIAMTILDYFDMHSSSKKAACNNISIMATDISTTALSTAIEGQYSSTAITRGLSSEYLNKYFIQEKDRWIIKDRVKNLVTFKKLNLKDASYGTFGPFDIVFLRNVIIYFSDDFKETLLNRIARLIKPEGCLFLGAGESVSGYSNRYDILRHKGSLFYRIKN